MLQKWLSLISRYKNRWVSLTLCGIVALSVTLTTAVQSDASWVDVLIQGVRVFQLSNISQDQEVNLGKQINRSLIQQRQVKISRNSEVNRYINDIGQRLAASSDRPSLPYTFQIVDDNNVNAFATMGGFVYVHTGLLALADNEAELASVMAHEIGHISGRHALKQMRGKALTQGLLSAAGLEQSAAVQIGVELALTRPNSREDELEADQLGLKNLGNAGYATIGMIDFMEKLLKVGGNVPEFLSTHPATSERIKALKTMINPQTASSGDGLNNTQYQRFLQRYL